MRGELLPVWPETWRKIWVPLGRHRDAPTELFAELFAEIIPFPTRPTPPESDGIGDLLPEDKIRYHEKYENELSIYSNSCAKYEEAANNGKIAKNVFRQYLNKVVIDEKSAINVLEIAFDVVKNYDKDIFTNKFFDLVNLFFIEYSIRYEIRRPFSIHTTLDGVFTKLNLELETICRGNDQLRRLARDYYEAFQDLSFGATPGRINTCFQKQVNLLEGLASLNPNVTEKTLGAMCKQLQTWPSSIVSDAVEKLYGFSCDHTGLRHGTISLPKAGKQVKTYRDMELRDLIAVSIFFTGVATYLSDQIDPEAIY